MDMTKLGNLARESAIDAFEGQLPHPSVAWAFVQCNPECFTDNDDEMEAIERMMPDPGIEFVAAYLGAYSDASAGEG